MKIFGLQKTSLVDYPGEVCATIFTGGCNFRCPYCHNRDLVILPEDATPYSEQEIFDFLTKRKNVLSSVCISGGEPTLCQDLPDFIRKIKELGYLVKLDTNGSNPSMLKTLVKDHLLDYIAMDIKHSKIKYPLVANCESLSIDDICESVDFLKQGLVPYEFRTTVAADLHKESDMTAIGLWLMGAKNYYIQPYKESDTVLSPGLHTPSKERLDSYVTIMSAFIPHVELRGDY